VRTNQKRDEIVRIAADLFAENGFERTSMAMVSDRLGGSKATLYGYFPSKDDLLRAVLDYRVATEADAVMSSFPAYDDLRKSLIALSLAYLEKRVSVLPITNIRMIANQPAGSTMGKEFHANIMQPAFERLTAKFKALMDEGKLKRADPRLVTMHWKGLTDWDFFERRLMGAIDGPVPGEFKKAATAAADAFLKLYAPEDQ
jgi:AcrR family transcriptional regulator